jgi:hypothetical protein
LEGTILTIKISCRGSTKAEWTRNRAIGWSALARPGKNAGLLIATIKKLKYTRHNFTIYNELIAAEYFV